MVPLWVPLTVAALGPLSALAGVALTQWWSGRREDARWKREREREREIWAREDTNRTFEQRRLVYIDFYVQLQNWAGTLYEVSAGLRPRFDGPELADIEDWHKELYNKLEALQLYADPQVSGCAEKAYEALVTWGNRTSHERLDEEFRQHQAEYNVTLDELRLAIRRGLGVPSG